MTGRLVCVCVCACAQVLLAGEFRDKHGDNVAMEGRGPRAETLGFLRNPGACRHLLARASPQPLLCRSCGRHRRRVASLLRTRSSCFSALHPSQALASPLAVPSVACLRVLHAPPRTLRPQPHLITPAEIQQRLQQLADQIQHLSQAQAASQGAAPQATPAEVPNPLHQLIPRRKTLSALLWAVNMGKSLHTYRLKHYDKTRASSQNLRPNC